MRHPFLTTPIAVAFLALLTAASLAAAEKPAKAPGSGIAGEDAGKADAKGAFKRQEASAVKPTGNDPAFVGAYIWGGRADQNYRPFFQWELRLAAGAAKAEGLRARIATLGPSRQVLNQGDWKDWGSIDANGRVDVDYRANCPNFPAYQVELSWSGGKETFLACDKGTVPLPLGALSGQGYVVAVNTNFETSDKSKSATITWTVWNVGGKPAQDVVQTIHFKDEKGAEVKAVKHKPEGGEVAAGLVKEQKVVVDKVPTFATVSISTEQADSSSQGESAGFTGAKDVETALIHAEGGKLKARVRNGLDSDQEGVVVTIALHDKSGKTLKTLDIPVGRLAKSEEKDISGDLGGTSGWAGYEVGWKGGQSKPAPAPIATAASGVPAPVTADGLTLTPMKIERTSTGLLLTGTMQNATGRDLASVRVTLRITDSANRTQEVLWKAMALPINGSDQVALACGLKDVGTIAMSWKTGAAIE